MMSFDRVEVCQRAVTRHATAAAGVNEFFAYCYSDAAACRAEGERFRAISGRISDECKLALPANWADITEELIGGFPAFGMHVHDDRVLVVCINDNPEARGVVLRHLPRPHYRCMISSARYECES